VAFRTEVPLPFVVILVVEFQGLPERIHYLHRVLGALGDDFMAKVAIHRDLAAAVSRSVPVIMAAEAAVELKVADVVRVHVPVYLHFREDILFVGILYAGDGLV
jgi:hypothetical protein